MSILDDVRMEYTETGCELETQRKEVEYLLFWFRTRSGIAEDDLRWYGDKTREGQDNITRRVGGKIRDMEKMIVKLRTEWDKFLRMKKKEKQCN